MGIFNFLKKKPKENEEEVGLTPLNETKQNPNPEEQKEEILSKEEIPPLGEIPLPPEPGEEQPQGGEASSSETPIPFPKTDEVPPSEPKEIEEEKSKDNSKENVEETESKDTESEDSDDGDDAIKSIEDPTKEFKDIDIPPVADIPEPPAEQVPSEDATKPELIEEPTTSDEKEKTETGKGEFELPDFDEEEIKDEEEPITEEMPADEEPKLDIESAEELNVSKEEENPTEKNKNYMNIENCTKVFEKVYNNQEFLKGIVQDIQKQEIRKKEFLEKYKEVHDELDIMQEILMKVDNALLRGEKNG